MESLTRDKAMENFMLAKARKKEMIAKMEVMMKEKYERTTGLKANYFFAM